MPQANDAVTQQYDSAISAAERVVRDTEGRYNAEIERLNKITSTIGGGDAYSQPTENPEYKVVAERVRELESSMRTAREQYTVLLRQKADALNRASATSTPEEQAHLTAQAAQATAAARQSDAQAAYLAAQTNALTATNETQRMQANAALQQASNGLIAAQAAMVNAQSNSALVPSQVARNVADANATNAGVGLTSAQAAQASANAEKLQQETEQLKRTLAVTTDADRRRSIEAEISAKEQQVNAIKAQIASSDAGITKGQQGPLYGYQQKIDEIKRLVASGVIKDEAAATQALQDGLMADVAGTTPYGALNDAQNRQVTQRGQDTNLVQTRTSSFGNLTGQSLGSLLDASRYGTPGSNAGAQAFGSVLGNVLGLYGGPQGFQTPAPVANDVPSFARNLVAPTPAMPTSAPSMPGPAPAPPQQPQPPAALLSPGATGTSADPRAAGSPALTPPQQPGFAQSNLPEGSMRGNVPAFAQSMGPVDQAYLDRLRQQRLAIVNGSGMRTI